MGKKQKNKIIKTIMIKKITTNEKKYFLYLCCNRKIFFSLVGPHMGGVTTLSFFYDVISERG